MQRRQHLLERFGALFKSIGLGDGSGFTCQNAKNMFLYHIVSRWEAFIKSCEEFKETSVDQKVFFDQNFPFRVYFSSQENSEDSLFPHVYFNDKQHILKHSFKENFHRAQQLFNELEAFTSEIAELVPFETLRTSKDRGNYLFTSYAKVVAMTSTHAALRREELLALHCEFDNIIIEEAAQILDIEAYISLHILYNLQSLALQSPRSGDKNRLVRVIMIGDHHQLPPVVQNLALKSHAHFDQSLFSRFLRLGVPSVHLDMQGRSRPELATLFAWRYGGLGTLPTAAVLKEPNAGLAFPFQFINVCDFCGTGESEPTPYFYQNLGEAEYVVQLYMYLRLIGYPRERIVLLCIYNGQKKLLYDIIRRRCESSESLKRIFGRPAKISTVDRFQGKQSDIVLLSLVRTKSPGHLCDIRRLIVAFSRARLGLYVFGRRELFERLIFLGNAFSRLFAHGDSLILSKGEYYGSNINKSRIFYEVKGVKHLGKIVLELSAKQLRQKGALRKWEEDLETYSRKVKMLK